MPTPTTPITITTPNTPELWDALINCRYRNLYQPFNLPHSCAISDLDHPITRPDITHAVVTPPPSLPDHPHPIIATARLDLQPDPPPGHPQAPAAQVRFFAVDPAARGTGTAQALMQHLEQQARQNNIQRIWMEARDAALGFYTRLGYTDFGKGPTKWNLIPHRLLQKNITNP